MKQWLLALCTFFFISTGMAASPSSGSENAASDDTSIVGDWRTIDDKTQQPRSIVSIYEKDGIYYGKVKELLAKDALKVCHQCPGEFAGKPTVGLRVLWDAEPSEDEDGLYVNAKLLDPKTGDIYSGKLRLSNDGKTLDVRGYIGISLFGRSQTWERVMPEKIK